MGKSDPANTANLGISFYFTDPFDFAVRDFSHQLDEIKATKAALNFVSKDNAKIYTLKKPEILVHSKLYYLYDRQNSTIESNAIVGSSNFTASGLGLYEDFSNKELNLLCDSKAATKDCKSYFDALLSECEDTTAKVQDALKSSFFYHTPQDIIDKIASLYKSEFEDLNKQEKRDLNKAAKAFGLYDFQKFAAYELLKRLKSYGVAMLADPVGSGKTLTALGVAASYAKVVIITPVKLKSQWESYFVGKEMDADIFSFDEATKAQALKASKIRNANLLIIDESHHFRNDNASYRKFKERLNNQSDLLLLSATPINNGYLDLGRQLSLNKDTIEISGELFNPLKICAQANASAKSEGKAVLNTRYYKLCNLIFSRSSKDIENFLIAKNKALPKQEKRVLKRSSIPENVNFSLDKLLEILGINDGENALTLCIYDPFDEKFLPLFIIDNLQKKNLENLGDYSTPRGFLCMNLVKALESSLDAFLQTLETIIKYHKNFLQIYENKEQFEFEIFAENEAEDGLLSAFPQRLKSVIKSGYLSQLSEDFIKNIREDLEKLENLHQELEIYDSKKDFKTSAKFKELRTIISNLGEKIHEEKLLIFTESIITANAITRALQDEFTLEIQSITGISTPSHFQKCKNLFSPKSLKYELKENEREIDILVATDCLSEGQNLQDCANFLNWDIAFNPVRSIQRIGRIWRIGSEHPINRITHFFPEKLDSYIQLEQKLRYKLEAASSATQVDNPFVQEQSSNEIHFNERKKQYEAIEKDIILNDENTGFANIQALLETHITKDLKSLNDGIFSICVNENSRENLLFACLQEGDKGLYHCVFDLEKNALLPSVSEEDAARNLREILNLEHKNRIFKREFERLEKITKDYTDLSLLKSAFDRLINELKKAIKENEIKTAQNAKTNALFVRKEHAKFKLIAWLLINPNFDSLKDIK